MTHSIATARADARRALVAAEAAPDEADILLAHILDKDRSYLFAYPEAKVTDGHMEHFQYQIAQRCAGVPVAYLTGIRDFWNLSLQVNRHTLIPRPETEHLVEYALGLGDAASTLRVLDLGTGSGAIALALAEERPHWQITASDFNPDTLAMAKQNATRLHLDQVYFLCSDWFAAIEGTYDVIISNPPYIADADLHVQQGDLRFEPRGALVSGGDGLQAIRQITEQAVDYLEPGGWLLLEHGFDQGAACRALFAQHGFTAVFTHPDLAGLDRLSGGCNFGLDL